MIRDLPQADTDASPRRRGRYLATVLANEPLCREHNRLVLAAPGFPPSEPGQFVQVKCRDVDDAALGDIPDREWTWSGEPALLARSTQPDLFRPTPILRRPFSIAGRRRTQQGDAVELINRDIGPGTHWLFNLRAGQQVDLIGPLGNAFALPAPGELALLVGGGVGIPPMIYIAQALAELNAQQGASRRREAIALCGALSLDLLPLKVIDTGDSTSSGAAAPRRNIAEFAAFGFDSVISTDDGSYGYPGRVTEALVHYLDHYLDQRRGASAPIVYTCGPEAMMKAVAAIAHQRNLPCQVAVERAMACGMGTCQSCVIRQTYANERGWRYRLACTDGPVFEASTLLW